MPALPILTYPEPILSKPAGLITNIDETVLSLVNDMKETMRAVPGLGLAAVQVGAGKSLFVYMLPEDHGGDGRFHVLINPRITASEGRMLSENEGCLSVPGIRCDVTRNACVTVEAVDENGRPVRRDAEGLEAVILQHEIDHLNGLLFLDRISRLKRDLYKKRLRKRARQD